MAGRLFTFVGGDAGPWRVTDVRSLVGDPWPAATHLRVVDGGVAPSTEERWALRGIISNERYVTRDEKDRLAAIQPGLGRPAAHCAALIPIRKSAQWWTLTQDERRAIFEERSHHVDIGLRHLPEVARRLHHCRDLSDAEPFDFLTWFEYAPEHASGFDALLEALRATEEWRYVEREVEFRLERCA